jgi:hypothetical protein
MREFVHGLETLTSPTRAATVKRDVTTYNFLLDGAMTRVLASYLSTPQLSAGSTETDLRPSARSESLRRYAASGRTQ